MTALELYIPPKPRSLWSVAALVRALWRGDGNLLELLPAAAYRFQVGNLGYSRRSTILFNDPDCVREILRDDGAVFPKSDLMVNALEPLIGQSIFVTDGARWARQRAMIDPAFSRMRLHHAFSAMAETVDDHESILRQRAERGETFSLDLAMSHLTADIICRTVFSTPLVSDVAREVFDDFTLFERSVAQVDILHLITKPAWAEMPQSDHVLAACTRIRQHLGALIDTHSAPSGQFDDIASAVMSAVDGDLGKPFSRDELIDQLGVFFLAGHETTASALTWVFYILAARPEWMAFLREEIDQELQGAAMTFDMSKRLPRLRAFFRETLRLYPPITFLPRVAQQATRIGGRKIRRGALVMISPWTLHRHETWWRNPHAFDPMRFMPGGEGDTNSGAYIPFGQGPHICVGAGFAQTEALLIMAHLIRTFDWHLTPGQTVRPAARLTTRPASQVSVHLSLRQ